jgi:hypothetical protein
MKKDANKKSENKEIVHMGWILVANFMSKNQKDPQHKKAMINFTIRIIQLDLINKYII